MRKSLVPTFLIVTAVFSTITIAQQPATLTSSKSGVGMGLVEIGNSSMPSNVRISVTGQSLASPPGATTAIVMYGRYSFQGPNRSEFKIWPSGIRQHRIKQGGPDLDTSFTCSPRGLGKRVAVFRPVVIGARIVPQYFPLRLSCTGIGKTPNKPGNPLKIYNGSMSGSKNAARDFGKVSIGDRKNGKIVVTHPGNDKWDIRIQWVVGPQRLGKFTMGGDAINMTNPAPYTSATVYSLGPGSPVDIPISFSPMYTGLYDAALEVRYDKVGTTDRPNFLFTYITGEGTQD